MDKRNEIYLNSEASIEHLLTYYANNTHILQLISYISILKKENIDFKRKMSSYKGQLERLQQFIKNRKLLD